MSHNYTGNPFQRPVLTVTLPNDGDDLDSASVDNPFDTGIDYGAWFYRKTQDSSARNWPYSGPGTLSGVTLTAIVDIAYVGGVYGGTWVMTEQDNTGYNTWQSYDSGVSWTQLGAMHSLSGSPTAVSIGTLGDAGTFGASGNLVVGCDNTSGSSGYVAYWNGTTWTLVTAVITLDIGGSASTAVGGGVHYYQGHWVVCGRISSLSYSAGGTFRGEAFSIWSTNGTTWTKGTNFRTVSGATIGHDYDGAYQWTLQDNGSIIVAVPVHNASSSSTSNHYATSSDGKAWTPRTGGWSGEPIAFSYDYVNGLFVVLDSSAALWTSPDAVTWTGVSGTVPIGTPTGMATLGGVWVVAGTAALAAYSPDQGANWFPANIGTASAVVKTSGAAPGFMAFSATKTKANVRALT